MFGDDDEAARLIDHSTDATLRLVAAPTSSRRARRKSPKQRTLQPPTLNPSAVMVFSRCHRDVRGDASKAFVDACTHHLITTAIDRRVIGEIELIV